MSKVRHFPWRGKKGTVGSNKKMLEWVTEMAVRVGLGSEKGGKNWERDARRTQTKKLRTSVCVKKNTEKKNAYRPLPTLFHTLIVLPFYFFASPFISHTLMSRENRG